MITEKSKQQIIEAADIRDVVSEFVELRKVGARYVCCCPFHAERTPSFSINTALNRYHCFGCGADGDSIEFLRQYRGMSFADALEWLGKRYHIDVRHEHRERSEDEAAEAKKKEAMLIALEETQRFFVAEFAADNAEAQAARTYAYGRWGEDFCKEKGIGYAPKGRAYIEHCKRKSVSEETLAELGLLADGENGKYAQFRNRITIPIRDRYGRVIAFTARYMGNNPDVGKYINSTTSAVWKKDETLFGIDAALRQARQSNCFIIVEGAPDVLRLQQIGLSEAVAPLGTALSEKQLDMLRPVSKTLRFIPDSDATKGRLHPPGEEAVMKNGATALRSGFDVYVREIPRTAEDDRTEAKHDPDSYIRSKETYLQLTDKHFAVWYAEKRFKGATSQDLRLEAMREVAGLLVHIEDTLTRDMCIDELSRIYGKAKMWKDAMKEAGKKAKEQAYKDSEDLDTKEIELLRKHNLMVRHNMYYTPGRDGELERLSNFILKPKIHVKGASALRVFHIVNEFGQEEDIELSQKTLGSLQAFQVATESLGNYVWLSKPDKFNRLKEYLYANTETAEEISVLGWNAKDKLFAFADGIHAGGRFIPINSIGVVNYGGKSYYLPAYSSMHEDAGDNFDFERQFQYRCGNETTLRQYVEDVARVFGDGGKVGIAWLLACLFRDYIHQQVTYFPMLNLFGIKSTGKTSLGVALASMFYNITDPPKLGNTTVPAMSYMMSHVRNSVLIFDEYTNLLKPRIIDLLKAIWNGKTNTKMNTADGGQGMVSKAVYSGVIISGQHQPTSDDALFSRCIHLAYTKTSFTAEERTRFEKLRSSNAQGNCHLAMEVLQHYGHFAKTFMPMFDAVRDEILIKFGEDQIDDRLLNNWAIPLTAYRVLEGCLDLPYSYADMFETFMRCLRYQWNEAKKNSETADFWRTLNGLRMIGKVLDGTHYVIKYQPRFTPFGKAETQDFGKQRPLLYMNWAAVQGVLSSRSNLNQMKMDMGALDNYLRHTQYFLGVKQQRFAVLTPQGTPDFEIKTENGRAQKIMKYTRPMALVFDYESLKASTEIDLETYIAPETSIEIDQDETPATQPDYEEAQQSLPF